ncbi:MAG TPA: AI-2E family transporter [Candidatus Acidoferrum sp.]|nr:AI-2E family transporter [Candidatus Acidoferrum sp.]
MEVRPDDVEHFDEPQVVSRERREPEPPAPQLSDLAIFLKRTRAVVPVAVVGLFLIALTAGLYFAKPFVMPIVIAALLTFLLKPLVRLLGRAHVPYLLGSVIVMGVFFGLLGFGVTRLLEPAAEWTARAPDTMRNIEEKFHHLFRRAQRISAAAAQVEDITKDATSNSRTQRVEVNQPVLMRTVFVYTTSFAAGLIETVVLLFFMLSAGDMFMEKIVRVLPTLRDKKNAVSIAHEVQHNLSTFLFTITLINASLGLAVGFAAWIVGLPNPALWGVLAGVLNFIPYFGPITGVVVLTLIGFVTFDQPWRAFLPALIYLLLHGIESNVITPMILGRRLTLNPLVIFISLMFWTWMWGIPGALLSIPMLMMLKVLCDHFKPLGPLGELLSG